MNISLKPIKNSDCFSLLTLYGNPKVTKIAGMNPVNQLQLNQMMPQLTKEGTGIYFNSQLVGIITLEDLENHTGNIGFLLSEKYWHQGIMKEALKKYLITLKQNKYHYIYANCFIENTISMHLLETLGFKYIQEFTAFIDDLNQNKTLKLYIKQL